MAIATYSDLQASALNWLVRPGDSTLSAVMPDMVAMVEAKLNRVLRVAQMEANATGTSDNGILTLPSDFVAWRKVEASPYGPLEYVTPDWGADAYPTGAGCGPKFFTVQGLTLTTYPTYTGELSIDYYATIPALSGSNTTNWLLTDCPDIYLFMLLVELCAFDPAKADRASFWNDRAMAAVEELKQQDKIKRYSRVSARVKGPTP